MIALGFPQHEPRPCETAQVRPFTARPDAVRATRKGIRSKAELDRELVTALESGCVQSRSHVEQMSISMKELIGRAFPKARVPAELDLVPFIARLRLIGGVLNNTYGRDLGRPEACWVSDVVRGWIAMAIGSDETLELVELLEALRPFARDHHFAVREWAWLAARPRVAADVELALVALAPFFASGDPRDRRFAVEITRPRSVWGQHIPELKAHPELAATPLESLRCEADPYARAAVGNWFNDAARTRPDWVQGTLRRWLDECQCRATREIGRRGSRGWRVRPVPWTPVAS